MNDEQLLTIHDAIHGLVKTVTINEISYPIKKTETFLRYIDIDGIKYMEQNAYKNSKYGLLAMQGHKITWIIRPGKWGLIMDGKVEN